MSHGAVSDSEGWLSVALDAANMGTWRYDMETGEFEWSRQVELIFGLNEGTFDSTLNGYLNRIHPDDFEEVQEVIDPILRGVADSLHVLHRIVTPTEEVRWIEGRGRLHRDREGRPSTVYGIVVDVTDQMAVERKLIEREERYRCIFEQSSDSIFIANASGGIVDANRSALQLFGYTPEEFLQRNLRDLHRSEWSEALAAGCHSLRGTGKFELESICLRKSGESFTAFGAFAILEIEGQRLIQAIYRDVTHQRATESAMLAAKEKAEESDRLKSAFLANISHEIRTPLNGIIGFSQILGMADVTTSERERYAEIVKGNGKRLLKLINTIVDVAHLESHQMSLHVEEFDLNALMMEVFAFFSSEIKDARGGRVELILSTDCSKPERVEGDELRLKQALSSLLDNAIKFTQDGYVRFGYRKVDSAGYRFFVKDTGIGVENHIKESIFSRFRQGSLSLSRDYEGVGLGLSICKGLVELMGGKIDFESTLGVGSEFVFTISLARSNEGSSPAENADQANPFAATNSLATKPRILVVEDNDANYFLLSEMLRLRNCEVRRATNGQEVLEILAATPNFSLVLMDMILPGMDGFVATTRIKERYPHLPVIAQSACAMPRDRQKMLEVGCDGVLTKPISAGALYTALEPWLRVPFRG